MQIVCYLQFICTKDIHAIRLQMPRSCRLTSPLAKSGQRRIICQPVCPAQHNRCFERETLVNSGDTTVNRGSFADSAGMIASIACAVHCAAMPMIIAYLPVLGLDWLAGDFFHQAMAIFCSALAVSAFIPGWRKHGSLVPAAAGLAGLALLTAAAFGLQGSCCVNCTSPGQGQILEPACGDAARQYCVQERLPLVSSQAPTCGFPTWTIPLMTPFGGLLLVVGHVVNHRRSCECRNSHCCLEFGPAKKT